MSLPISAIKSHALDYALVDMSMSWAKRLNESHCYREAAAGSGSFDSFSPFVFGAFSIVENLELVSGQHFLTRKHIYG
jgi:hypothetical protein